MNGPSVARLLARLINLVVLVVSGAYLIVYLYRWEWNRAVISGVFFIAAEIALATTFILNELRRRPIAREPAAERTSPEPQPDGRRGRFEWLTHNDELGVFVPVLLGAGVLLSALAYVVERIAAAFSRGGLDGRAPPVVDLDLPLGTRREAKVPSRARNSSVARALGWFVAIVAMALLVGSGIDLLADATQSRPEERERTTGTTTVTVDIDQKNMRRPDGDLAEALWVVCRNVATPGADLERVRAGDGHLVELVIHPAMGELRRRRVFGCLQDALIDRVHVAVVAWSIR